MTVTVRLATEADYVETIDLPTTHGLVLVFRTPAPPTTGQHPQPMTTVAAASIEASDDNEDITWEDAEWR